MSRVAALVLAVVVGLVVAPAADAAKKPLRCNWVREARAER